MSHITRKRQDDDDDWDRNFMPIGSEFREKSKDDGNLCPCFNDDKDDKDDE